MMSTALAQTRGEALPGKPAVWDKFREIHFVLHDPLDHPFYWWPRTLLGYPIEFHTSVDLDRLRLTRVDTLEQVPIQFSEVVRDKDGIRSATLHFVSDLPSGGRREFVLSAAEAPGASASQAHETHEGNTIVLDSGAMRVRIPATQAVHGNAPGPVMQVSRGGPWIGSSTLSISEDRVTRIAANRVANGPLFIAYELTYETVGGSRYVASVQCDGGFDFVRLRENMDGLRPGARGAFTCDWTELNPTYRQAPNHPFPVPDKVLDYDEYVWERIDAPWHNLDARCGSSRPIYPEVMPSGELPIVLGIYQPAPGNFLIANWANFWNEHANDALGVFIDNATEWRDHEYAYELESPALQVRTFYGDGKFSWKWPFARGCRSMCLAFYDHVKDKETMRELLQNSQPVEKNGVAYQVPLGYTSHTLFLQNRYGTIDLNRVKDWVLEYPESSRRQAVIFTGGSAKEPAQLEQSVMTLPYVCTLPVTGARQMDGAGPLPGRGIVNFSPVPSRRIEGSWIDGFNRLNAAMNERQRARLTAMYLFLAYVQGGDEFMPVVPMLSGHPNYLADVKFAPPAMSFLFPEHPMSSTWADMWQKCMELNTRYNTRAAVETWDADGGRWTEDIGTYVFAFLRPALRTAFLLRKLDGVQRFATPQLAEMADWLVNALSAPYEGESPEGYRNMLKVDNGRSWGVVGPGEGPRRVYPPIGAHSERRMPPRSLWYLGTCLRQYAPMAAEHAMWASRPTDRDAESAPGSAPPWDDIMYREPENRGTNPHLRSRKHTGYGVVLRAAVGTPDEVSVHLQQIDEGPNYRWGWAGQGGCGALYFFAAGKAYGFNGSEDGGDRRDADTDFCTNFGVFKDGEFRSVGKNVLSRPFYDLNGGQFMEIVPREDATPYSFPEYVGRSVLLSGHDYFVLYDQVRDPSVVHRLSWFVRRGDELPAIHLLQPASAQRTDMQTATSTGVWFDGSGDSMAVVSHRGDLQSKATPYGCRVVADGIDDMIFRSSKPIHFSDATASFDGTAGLIRHRKDASEFAMFHGTRIGVSGLVFVTTDTDLGIGGSMVPGQPPRGEYYAPKPSTATLLSAAFANSGMRFYIDGEAQASQPEAGGLVLNLQAGHHHWELTDALPVPIAPHIVRTVNRAGGARVFVAPVASASKYRLELSKDDGVTWSTISVQANHEIEVNDLPNGDKVHVRAVALNALHESLPGPEYPLYVSSDPPAPPDGLHVELSDGAATLTWGEVLGVTEYRLYARAAGSGEFQVLYSGLDRLYRDKREGIQAPLAVPENDGKPTSGLTEYCVCAVNGNGEGPKSRAADTNPASWRNWDPRPGERFRRVYSFSPDAPASADAEAAYYPR
ncbi:MAG TPA: hypothetical protein VFC39_19275 [Acidobacteriaceae bacterium]|nr:hypothetical protein [Acidobacteriaceae bacterium]